MRDKDRQSNLSCPLALVVSADAFGPSVCAWVSSADPQKASQEVKGGVAGSVIKF